MAAELAPGGAAVEGGPALETEEDTDAAGCGLRPNATTEGVLSFANPTTRRNSSGLRSDWARPKVTGRPDRRDTSPIQAISARVSVRSSLSRSPRRDALEHAAPVPAQHIGEGVQLVRWPTCREPAGRRAPCAEGCVRSKAQRLRLHGLVHQFDHGGDVLVGRRRAVHAALAHGVLAHGAVPHHAPDVRALGEPVHRVQVLAVRDPVPGQAVQDGLPGMSLDALHELGQIGPVLGPARGEGDTAVAHDDAGHAVPATRRTDRIPGELGVEMGVDVDEARGHDAPVGVELPVTRGVDHRVHGDHAVADHTYISLSGRSPCAVDDGSIANDQIHVHKPSPCSGMAYPSVSTHPVPCLATP